MNVKKSISSLIKSYLILLLPSVFLLTSGCSKYISGPDDNTLLLEKTLSNFSEIQNQVFTPSCATAGCHAGESLQANLDLTEGNAYDNLVNKTSLLNPNFLRVFAWRR